MSDALILQITRLRGKLAQRSKERDTHEDVDCEEAPPLRDLVARKIRAIVVHNISLLAHTNKETLGQQAPFDGDRVLMLKMVALLYIQRFADVSQYIETVAYAPRENSSAKLAQFNSDSDSFPAESLEGLLDPRGWLDDEVINGFVRLLNKTYASVFFFHSHFMDALLKKGPAVMRSWLLRAGVSFADNPSTPKDAQAPTHRRIFGCPINISNSHWVGIAIDFELHVCMYFDSLGSYNRGFVGAFLEFIAVNKDLFGLSDSELLSYWILSRDFYSSVADEFPLLLQKQGSDEDTQLCGDDHSLQGSEGSQETAASVFEITSSDDPGRDNSDSKSLEVPITTEARVSDDTNQLLSDFMHMVSEAYGELFGENQHTLSVSKRSCEENVETVDIPRNDYTSRLLYNLAAQMIPYQMSILTHASRFHVNVLNNPAGRKYSRKLNVACVPFDSEMRYTTAALERVRADIITSMHTTTASARDCDEQIAGECSHLTRLVLHVTCLLNRASAGTQTGDVNVLEALLRLTGYAILAIEAPRQNNGSDCGVFTVAFLRLAAGGCFAVAPGGSAACRQAMARELRGGALTLPAR